ncbi:MAG: hypothetical protein HOL85_18295 [Rhodospirillaceae bacterium]|jgi:localization factor PodJL|nr:hypothetical protein [Rhodospirillaceae bacterium]MBT6137208.1 hypothetical protein [Rhodospirillaceae bacterium]
MAKSASSSNHPWSIKGISEDARAVAKEAAAREGITMGEWLTRAISRAGGGEAPEMAVSIPDETAEEIAGKEVEATTLRDEIARRVREAEDRMVGLIGPLEEVITEMSRRLEVLEGGGQYEPQEPSELPRPRPELPGIELD